MLTRDKWNRNVGTSEHPVSFLHEYAVGLIWDRLHQESPVALPTVQGTLFEDVMAGVDKVIIPDALQSVAGCIPDISLLQDSRPLRCIEVVVTNPASDEKVRRFQNLGVDLIQVPVRDEEELRGLFPLEGFGNWWPKYSEQEEAFRSVRDRLGVNWRGSRQFRLLRAQENADAAIKGLMDHLSICSPEVRRPFFARLLEAGSSLDSLYPIRKDNPKYECLFHNTGAGEQVGA